MREITSTLLKYLDATQHVWNAYFLNHFKDLRDCEVRGAKPWAAAHYFLAAIRCDRVYTSCAIATARFRAKPSRA